jgi:hypothetical protein
MNRVFLAGVCVLAGLFLGLVSSNSLIGQQVPRPAEAGRVGKYQFHAVATQHNPTLYFLDTETGQLWTGFQGIDKTGWQEIGSPVRPAPKKK